MGEVSVEGLSSLNQIVVVGLGLVLSGNSGIISSLSSDNGIIGVGQSVLGVGDLSGDGGVGSQELVDGVGSGVDLSVQVAEGVVG